MVVRGWRGWPGEEEEEAGAQPGPRRAPGGPRAAPVRAVACGEPGLRGGGAGPGRSGVTGLEAARPLLPASGAAAEGPSEGQSREPGLARLGRGQGPGAGRLRASWRAAERAAVPAVRAGGNGFGSGLFPLFWAPHPSPAVGRRGKACFWL